MILLGKTSSDNTNNVGDFPNNSDTIKYYSGYASDVRKVVLTGTNNLVIPESEHNISSKYIFTGISESIAETELDNSVIVPEVVAIDGGTNEITITNINNTGSPFTSYVYFSDKSAVTGSVYHSLGNTIPDGGTTTVTVPAATHQLTNNNILIKTFITSGGDLPDFFDKRAQSLLFEHRLEREEYTKSAETFMDIYISVVIAAPMILMLLLMMMKISGLGISLSSGMITRSEEHTSELQSH